MVSFMHTHVYLAVGKEMQIRSEMDAEMGAMCQLMTVSLPCIIVTIAHANTQDAVLTKARRPKRKSHVWSAACFSKAVVYKKMKGACNAHGLTPYSPLLVQLKAIATKSNKRSWKFSLLPDTE